MRNLKDIILEKLKVSNDRFKWAKTITPDIKFKTLADFGKLFVQKLGDNVELQVDDIYDYLDINLPESISYNTLQSKGGKSYKRVKFVDYLSSIQCFKHEKYDYIVGLNYKNGGHHSWEPLTDESLIDFIKMLGNDDEETGRIVFDNILKKLYYKANE